MNSKQRADAIRRVRNNIAELRDRAKSARQMEINAMCFYAELGLKDPGYLDQSDWWRERAENLTAQLRANVKEHLRLTREVQREVEIVEMPREESAS